MNLEFQKVAKRQAAGGDFGLLPHSDEFLDRRAISLVVEEIPETVSRGTSPISRTLLRQNSNPSSPSSSRDSVFRAISLSKCLDEDNEINLTPIAESDVIGSKSDSKEEQDIDDERDENENLPELVNSKRFYAIDSYEKQDNEEVNLQENAEVEVLRESEGGWWLVRTSSHSVGWAPSNFLEKVQSLRKNIENTNGTEIPGESRVQSRQEF